MSSSSHGQADERRKRRHERQTKKRQDFRKSVRRNLVLTQAPYNHCGLDVSGFTSPWAKPSRRGSGSNYRPHHNTNLHCFAWLGNRWSFSGGSREAAQVKRRGKHGHEQKSRSGNPPNMPNVGLLSSLSRSRPTRLRSQLYHPAAWRRRQSSRRH